MSELVSVGQLEDYPPGTVQEVVASGRIVALYNVEGTLHAIDGICPHAGGPLGEGTLIGNIVTCPWHGWQFDVCTGSHCLTPNIRQEQFSVEVTEGEIFLRIP